jgi:hypothetical protein
MERRSRGVTRFGPVLVWAACVLGTGCDTSGAPEREVQSSDPIGAEAGDDAGAALGGGAADASDAGIPESPDGGAAQDGDAGVDAPDGGAAELDAGPPQEVLQPRRIVALETHVPTEVRAGQTFTAECLAIDDLGEAELLEPARFQTRVSPQEAVQIDAGFSVLARQATTLEVWCQSSELALIDETPATVRVVPGEPALVETLVGTHVLTAGDALDVFCRAYDAYRNPVEVTPGLRVLPSDGGFVSDGRLTFTRAGVYQVGCEVAGAAPDMVAVEVRPGAAVALAIARIPDEHVYPLFAVVQLAPQATDAYGNLVPSARVALHSDPPAAAIGQTRLRFANEGTFTVVATLVDDPTISVSTEITVNGVGPEIVCGTADATLRDGSMVRMPANGRLTFEGSVADANQVQSLRVNGVAATPDAEGRFAVPLDARFGMNFVDIVAVDGFGVESTRVCSFLAAGRFQPEQDLLGGAVTLSLAQAALDDRNAQGEINSLNDLLHAAINARALRDELHAALLAENPVKPSSCDQKVLGVCVFRTKITYLDSELRGPNSTSLTLIPSGVRARVVMNDVRLKLRVDGTLDSTGWAKFSRIAVDVDFDAKLVAGKPSIRVRPDSVNVTVEGISTDFGGVSGFFLDIVLSIAKGTLRDAVRNLVRDWVRDNFNQILDGVLGGLDIASLGSSFSIKSLDGSRDVRVNFGLGFSSLDVTPSRMRFGIATRFTSVPILGAGSLGVAIPDGGTLRERDGTTPAELAVQVGVLNQALHALWRAGLFEGNLARVMGGGPAVDGLQIIVSAQLPPVAHLRADGRAELGLGALHVSLVYPGLWDEPIAVSLGARATMRAQLAGDDLSFSDLAVEELLFSPVSAPLDTESREVLEEVLLSLVQGLVSSALNDAIPALPIPSFALPAALADFGLPAGARLGLTNSSLAVRPPHFVLRSGFGIGGRP